MFHLHRLSHLAVFLLLGVFAYALFPLDVAMTCSLVLESLLALCVLVPLLLLPLHWLLPRELVYWRGSAMAQFSVATLFAAAFLADTTAPVNQQLYMLAAVALHAILSAYSVWLCALVVKLERRVHVTMTASIVRAMPPDASSVV